MRVPLKLLDSLFSISVLFLSTGAFLPLVMDISSPARLTKGTLVIQIAWAGIYAITLVRAIPHYRDICAFAASNKLLILLLLMAVMSTMWSDDPGQTFRRSIALVGTMLFGVDFALRYPLERQLKLISIALGLAVFSSLLVQLVWPGSIPTVDPVAGDGWNGAFDQKNVFGRVIVLAMLSSIVYLSDRSALISKGLIVSSAFALILASRSRGALVVGTLLLLLLTVIRFLRSLSHPRIAYLASFGLGALGIVASYLTWLNFDYVTGVLGRDATLTGRIDLWRLAFASLLEHPWLGYGYSGFWNVTRDALRINGALNWTVPHAHNGLLDLSLELGVIGLGLYLAYYVLLLLRTFWFFRISSAQNGTWVIAYLAFALVYSLTESSTLAGNSIFGILYASVACSVSPDPVPKSRPVTTLHQPQTPSDRIAWHVQFSHYNGSSGASS